MAHKIIIDCDPGNDDVLALLLAVLHPDIELLGVTTVAGNSTLDNTTANALAVLDLAGAHAVEVHAGAGGPLLREQVVAHHIHGLAGLAPGAIPPSARSAASRDAVGYLARRLLEQPGEITLVAIGPLTNVALLAGTHPEAVRAARGLALMGGGVAFGNVTPVAEFNIYADPEAAAIALAAPFASRVIAPLDLTHQALAGAPEIERLRAASHPRLDALADLLQFARASESRHYGLDAAVLHDPCVVGYLIDPGAFTGEDLRVEVETRGTLTYGQLVVDVWRRTSLPANAHVLRQLDRDRFLELLLSTVERLAD